jgi:hypothetical protein
MTARKAGLTRSGILAKASRPVNLPTGRAIAA